VLPNQLDGAGKMHGSMVNAYKILVGKSVETDHLENVWVKRTVLTT
jgi:hypothetical protein